MDQVELKLLKTQIHQTLVWSRYIYMTFFILGHMGRVRGTTLAPPYKCIFMDQVELKLLKTQIHQTLVWSRYIYMTFFILGHMGKII